MKAKVMPAIIGAPETIQNHSDNTWATYQEIMKSRNYTTAILDTADILQKVLM